MSDVNTIPPPDAPAAPAPGSSAEGGLSAAKLAILQARLRGKQVQAPRPPGASGAAAPIVPRAPGDEVPLSFSQERLWFLDRLQPGLTAYNMPGGLRLTGELDPAALERALGEVIRRHEILRTTFQGTAGAPVQVIAPFTGLTLPVEDLSGLDRAEAEDAVKQRVADEAALPFDLAAGPLFRPILLRLGEQEHVLLLSMHHGVTDAWSGQLFLREVSTLYETFRAGQPSPLPELPVQYGDYALWQRRTVQGEMLERQVEYWKRQLAGAPPVLELPADHPRPPVVSYRGASVPAYARPEVLERLRVVARGEGATLFMVLLAAFQALLGRYAGTEDVVVGSPVAGRGRAELEGMIGMFVNTLVLRTDLSGDPEFRALLRRVRETTLGALGHQDVPFERLVTELQTERTMSRSALFQVAFQLEDLEESTPAGGVARAMEAGRGGMRVQAVVPDTTAAKFDLTLSLQAHVRGITGTLAYSTDLFEAATVRRMTAHLDRVLQQVAADPGLRLSQLELMDGAERARVVEEWNRTDAAFPADACIHELFEAQAERTPDATAVVFEDDSLTYRTLNARANRLAHDLVRRKVGPETRVGVCMERGLDMVVTLLAVLKAGGAYVPMDPGLPPERLAYMLADSNVSLLLTQEVLRKRIPAAAGVKLLTMDGAASEGRPEDDLAENPRGRATPDGLAYVIYTSGSTGRPKGVMNAHRGVVNRLAWMQAEYGLGAADVVLQKTPFSFDVSVWEFFWPLQQGATLVMARPDGHRDPAYLQEVIERRGVTTLHFVPSMLQPFVEAADAARCASLRRVICSGEALPAALVGRFHARFPEHVALHNLYGPTEAAVDVSHWACGRDDAGATVPIGRPVWNTRLYVLDAALGPVPVGIPGELYIGGVQVARGYLGRPALTAERFGPDPFSATPGARLYRTGDRARWRDDGALEYLGRLDDQVKIRGFRIEPGEVEAALRQHPGVRDCAVVARMDDGEARLAAYVVGEAAADELNAHLRQSLPEYMVPSAFVALDALPLTPSGKLDRNRLPAPEYRAAAQYVAPRTPAEEMMAQIWTDVLKVERVGVEDNFFEMGGHSLRATLIVTRVEAAFGMHLPLRAIFDNPTIAGLVAALESAEDEIPDEETEPLAEPAAAGEAGEP